MIAGKKIIEARWSGDRPIKQIVIKYGDEIKLSSDFATGTRITGSARTALVLESGEHIFEVEVTDIYGFLYTKTQTLLIGNGVNTGNSGSTKSPTISLINPRESSPRISLYSGDTFNLRFSVDAGTAQREVSVTIDGNVVQSASSGDIFVIPIGSQGLTA